jgi:hypothetical protein
VGTRAYKEEMLCGYTTSKDLEQRLNNTMCRYEGLPVYVRTDGDKELFIYDPVDNKKLIKKIKPNDPSFDISIMEVGYFNYVGKYGDGVRYAMKHPQKQWKAALTGLTFLDIQGGKIPSDPSPCNQGFVDSLLGKFPPIIDALAMVSSGQTPSLAVSQDVAFGKTPVGVTFIYYRTKPVGWVAPDEHKVNVVNHDYKWVIERLLTRSGLTL